MVRFSSSAEGSVYPLTKIETPSKMPPFPSAEVSFTWSESNCFSSFSFLAFM